MPKKVKKIGDKIPVLNLYAVKVTKKSAVPYYGPFVSLDDDMALVSFAEIAKTEPMLERSYLYRIGSFNQETGVLKSCRNTLVVAKKVGKEKKNEKVSDAV